MTARMANGGPVYTEVFEYDYVDVKPEFPGGGKSLINFVNSNRNYPALAYQMGIEGRVTCAFVVNPDGKISNIQLLRGVEPSLNQEAIRIISLMPQWKPGKINDTPVPVRVVCCIPFRK
ncbi:MAG: energy transducer TonB [Muribaculaceae bacterium]|nr:energy transducer TonB [Muribaculaceae bacterium]